MTILLVGADRLGNIPDDLQNHGFKKIIHWDGRKSKEKNKNIPTNTNMVLVFSDYINHGLMYQIKKEAKDKKIPIIFSKRSRNCLLRALNENGFSANNCITCLNSCPFNSKKI